MKSPPPAKCFVCCKGNRALFIVSSDINRPPSTADHFHLCAFCLDDWRFAITVTSKVHTTTTNRTSPR